MGCEQSSQREHHPSLRAVLVTGATGFIGARLVRRLLEGRSRVSCLVRTSSSMDSRTAKQVQSIAGDVTDRACAQRALDQSRATTVFHLAGLVRARRRNDFMRVNAGGVETLAAACADRVDAPVLVVISSLAAAGPCAANRLRVERETPAPVSAYGRSKLAGERAAMKYAQALPITIMRPPMVFGPGDRGLLQMFRPVARWGIHLVPGGLRGGEHRYSLVHVDDLVDGLLLAAEKGERLCQNVQPGQGIYYLAGKEQPTYTQLGQVMAAALGQHAPVVIRLPAPLVQVAGVIAEVAGALRRPCVEPGWISRDKITEALAGSWVCSSAKAKAQLGWSPAGTLATQMSETAKWYREAKWL